MKIRYDGTRGNTQGLKKERSPVTKDTMPVRFVKDVTPSEIMRLS